MCNCVRIPLEDPLGDSIILPQAEFERITSTSRVLIKEDREALKQAYQRKRDEEIVWNKHSTKTVDLQIDTRHTKLFTYLFFSLNILIIQKAAEEWKHKLYAADLSREENQSLNEMELEARGRAQFLVDRANVLRMEQEEEIKRLNQVRSSCRCVGDKSLKKKKPGVH